MSAKSVPLTPVDAAWLHMEDPTNLMMITGVMLFKERIDFGRVKELYRTRLLPFDRFRQRVVESGGITGMPRWEIDPQFDLDAHCHHVALPDAGSKDDLIDFLSDIASTPLDFSKPLWQVHVVDNVMGGSALVMRIHHCIGDGTALVAVTMRLFDDRADAPSSFSSAPERQRKQSGILASLTGPAVSVWKTTRSVAGAVWQESAASVLHPSHIVELARSGVSTAAQGAATVTRALLQPNDPITPFKGKLGVKKRVAWSEPVDLDAVKAIGRRLDAKVNDVLVAAMTGALRHYLLERNVPVEGLEIHSVIPVDLRPPEKALNLGNVFGMVFLGMPVGIDNPIERLRQVKMRMDRLKQSGESLLYYSLLNVFGLTPKQVEEAAVDFFGARATAVFTNVVGPRTQLYLAGVPVENIMFWVPQAGRLGMGISIYSYNGRVTLGLITDAGLTPDPEKITERFNEEFRLLLRLVGEQKTSIRTASSSPPGQERQCAAQTKSGSRCRNRAMAASEFCHVHQGKS